MTAFKVLGQVIDLIAAVFRGDWGRVGQDFQNINNIMAEALHVVVVKIRQSIDWLGLEVLRLLFAMTQGIEDLFMGLVHRTEDLIGVGFKAAVLNPVQNVHDEATRLMQQMADTLGGIWDGLKGVASSAWGGITGAIKNELRSIVGVVNDFVKAANTAFGSFGLKLPTMDVPGLAAGGNLGSGRFASGGVLELASGGRVGAGFMTNGPSAIVGEGRAQFPEYVIPSDPAYRSNALSLMGAAARTMGLAEGGLIPALADGGSLDGSWGGQCIAKGTLISTEGGQKPIEDVGVGELVWTRRGLKRVGWSGLTRPDADVLQLVVGDSQLTCTPDHRLLRSHPGHSFPSTSATLAPHPARCPDQPSIDFVVGMPMRTANLVHFGPSVSNDLQGSEASLATTRSEVRQERNQNGPHVKSAVGLPSVHSQVGVGAGVELIAMTAPHDLGEVVHDIGVGHPQPHAHLALSNAVGESDVPLSFEEASRPGGFEWVAAEDLRIGDVLLKFHNGYFTPAPLRTVRGAHRTDTYDLTVEDAHEFVANGVVVHNCVVFVEHELNRAFPVAAAKDMAPMVNTQTAKTGELAIFTGGPYGHVGIVSDPMDQQSFQLWDSNWVGPETIGHHVVNRGTYGFAGFADLGSGVPGGLAAVAGGLASGALDKVFDPANSAMKGLPGVLGPALGIGMLKSIEDGIKSKMASATSFDGAPGVAAASGAHGDWLHTAEQIAGVGIDWDSGLSTIIEHESGWSNTAQNNTDINAQRGDPSRGLMQLTLSNQRAYGGITDDPIQQIVEGIRYIQSRYGGIGNVPGVRSVLAGGSYQPYDEGGLLPPGLSMAMNGTGASEHVFTAGQMRSFTRQEVLLGKLLSVMQDRSAPIEQHFHGQAVDAAAARQMLSAAAWYAKVGRV